LKIQLNNYLIINVVIETVCKTIFQKGVKLDFKYAQSWLLGVICFVYGIYRIIGGTDAPFNWVDIVAIIGFCYSVYITQLSQSRE
jgi:hypothetical protein